MLGIWGFGHAHTGFHRQPYYHAGQRYEMELFTVIAARNADLLR
jgi:hypothetical protein